jgi:hypothetical protein
MNKTPDKLLALKIGETSVAENLRRSIESGRLVEDENGTLTLPGEPKRNDNWVYVTRGPALGCRFLMDFMFHHAYAEAAVPSGCSGCYKVKVVTRTLRELAAAWEIAKRVNCSSKWGTDLSNPYSQSVYAGYFYVTGLDAARALFKVVRQAFDKNPKLGPGIRMTIKRGCSEYEAVLGPSDRYEFTPEMAELEADLKTRFRPRKAEHQPSMVVAQWIETAFRIGDDTYLDFTGGKPLRKRTVTYDPL